MNRVAEVLKGWRLTARFSAEAKAIDDAVSEIERLQLALDEATRVNQSLILLDIDQKKELQKLRGVVEHR